MRRYTTQTRPRVAPAGHPDLVRRHNLGPQVMNADCRRREIANFLTALVRPVTEAAR